MKRDIRAGARRHAMTLYQIKPQFQECLRPLVRRLADWGARANQVTVVAAAASLVVGAMVAALAQRPAVFLIMPAWLFVRMALNAIDGMLAREHGQQSTLGAYLNELGDLVSDLALIAPFVRISAFGGADVVVFALLAVLVECAGLIGPLARASRRYDGPLGKSDRAFILGALSLWIGLGMGLGPLDHIVWIVLSMLSILTIFKRVRGGLHESGQALTQSSEPIL
jgi:CDP-diacylglycerol--glycerol-3-phosphate 3-phosphatidyltransferase